MYNHATNEILFPHIVPGNVLGDKQHTFNNVNGGVVPIEKFNLVRNKFFGGNVKMLGKIKEYGFYACPHFEKTKIIVGFYIHDPEDITEEGKKLLEGKYPDRKIVYKKVTSAPHRKMTTEEMKKKKELIQQAMDNGSSSMEINNATVQELEGLLKAQSSGKSDKIVQVEDSSANKEKVPVKVVHKGSKR